MFTGNLRRGPFFLYSMGLGFIEFFLDLTIIASTMGLTGFVESRPGPGREGITLGVFIIGMILMVFRANISIRRNRDRGGSKKFIWGYVALLVMLAVFSPFEVLFYQHGEGGYSNPGLSILSIISFGLWLRLVFSSSDSESSGDISGEIAELAAKYGRVESEPPAVAFTPVQRAAAPTFTPGGSPSFGKRR